MAEAGEIVPGDRGVARCAGHWFVDVVEVLIVL